MQFGLTTAPAVFKALVKDVSRDMLEQYIFVYLDDTLIFSKYLIMHQHICPLLLCLLLNHVFIKMDKGVFYNKSTSFLCSIIRPNQISKILTRSGLYKIHQLQPSASRSTWSWVSFISIDVSSGSLFKFTRGNQNNKVFKKLKSFSTSTPVLHPPDLTQKNNWGDNFNKGAFWVKTASANNKVHPCVFFSRKLSDAENTCNVGTLNA